LAVHNCSTVNHHPCNDHCTGNYASGYNNVHSSDYVFTWCDYDGSRNNYCRSFYRCDVTGSDNNNNATGLHAGDNDDDDSNHYIHYSLSGIFVSDYNNNTSNDNNHCYDYRDVVA
jgi:hypothetical protein